MNSQHAGQNTPGLFTGGGNPDEEFKRKLLMAVGVFGIGMMLYKILEPRLAWFIIAHFILFAPAAGMAITRIRAAATSRTTTGILQGHKEQAIKLAKTRIQVGR